MEHRQDPSADPDGGNSVFCQIYEGLKMKDKALDYRYSVLNENFYTMIYM